MKLERRRPELRAAISEILDSNDIDTAWGKFCDALEDYGFDKILYGGTRIPTRGIIGDVKDALILYRGSQDYADAYLGEELYLHSPTYEWAENNTGFASWPDAMAQFTGMPTPQLMRIAQLNAEVGALSGFVGSLKGVVPGMRGVIGISPAGAVQQREADEMWARDGKDIEMLSQLVHVRIASLPQTGQRRPLTSRQREALQWCAQGKTMQDVATIMGLSIGTVEKHLRMARDSLDAQTTAHAVQKATSLNLLVADG